MYSAVSLRKTVRKVEQAFKDAAEAVEVMIAEGPDAAMNQFNGHK